MSQIARDISTSPVRTAAVVLGIVLLLLGVLGFIPGVTTSYDEMELAGHESNAKLLGLFQVSVLHNILHLLLGGAGLVGSRFLIGARLFLLIGGIIFIFLSIFGVIIHQTSEMNFVPMNDADDLLHAALGLIMLNLGLMLRRQRT